MPKKPEPKQCVAVVKYGSVWEAGRRRCSAYAMAGSDLCSQHRKIEIMGRNLDVPYRKKSHKA